MIERSFDVVIVQSHAARCDPDRTVLEMVFAL
jgi:hypothetical protein